ncbi:potassium channel family protein [Allohahella marinimesophila]|uniref:Potassium channel family protein n=1 Tax=Allohahella marinimesophila TaxID=1054972 RepID=A0ABP7PRU2_9GAMM
MSILMTIAGAFLVLLVWFDFVATALTASQSGPVSRRVAYGVWRVFLFINKPFKSHALLACVGPLIIIVLINMWVSVVWLGWSLIYLGAEAPVLNGTTLLPADISSTIYFVGFTLTTLGTGDYVPADGFWQAMTVITAFNGIALITLSITYAIPVVQAAAAKRTVARQIAVMGESAEALAAQWAEAGHYQGVDTYFSDLTPQILDISQKHLAYPILHFFHSPEPDTALPLKLAALDEAILALPAEAYEVNPALRVAEHMCSNAISTFLNTLNKAFIHPADEEPPQILPQRLRKGTAKKVGSEREPEALSRRRKLLKALILQDGWTWNQIAKG